jgi:hypothetical protein
MRTRIAILMAVIATFGAVVAYRAVIAEEETSSGERRLEQGQILELNRRADLLDTYRESAVFEDSENLARERGFYLQEQARKARQTFPTNFTTANQLDLQAEEQFAIARMYRRTEDFNYVSGMSASATIESGIEKNVATELSEAGYGAVWKEPVGDKAPDIWSDLKEDIARSRLKTVCLSGLVAIFVLALAFLTFTQLPRDGSPVQRWLERLAIFIAVGASIACFVIDGHSWLPFLLAGLGIGVVALLGHLLYERPAVQQWLNGPKEVVIPEKERKAVAKAITEAAKGDVTIPVAIAVPDTVAKPAVVAATTDALAQAPLPIPELTQKEAAEPVETVQSGAATPIEAAKPGEVEKIREAIIRDRSAVESFVAANSVPGPANPTVAAGENHSGGEAGHEEKEEEPSHPHEVGPRVAFIGAHLLAWDCTSTMNRFALSLIAVTALLAAVCGWRYDCATAFANGCAARAMEQQVAAFKNFERSQTAIHYIWGIDARMHEARMRYKAAEQRAELGRDKAMGVTADREPAQMEWQKALLTQNKRAVEELDGDSGPEADPYYPQKQAELGGRRVSETAFAKWDAENELRQSWHLKAAQYLLTLTMFAIALYLLGQSMGMGLGRGAFILVLGGSLIAGVGAFSAVKTAVHYLPRDASKLDAAAEAYGEGREMYVVAHDSDDYAQAAEKFDAALKIRPTFALAHYYRGESLFNSARVHPDEQDSLPSRKSGVLAQTVREMAISLDDFNREGVSPPEELVGRYGFFTLLQSLSPPDPALLKKGTATLREGIKAYRGDAWLQANLAVALLISGQIDDARKAYDSVFADDVSPELAIAAMGDLEIARRYCNSFPHADCATITAEINKLKPRFAAAAGPQPKDAHWEDRHPSLSAPQISISPAVVKWSAVVDAAEDKDVLLVIWYWKDPDWGAWRVISSVSRKVRLERLVDEGGNRKSLTLSYLDDTWDHRCLPGGDFRAEFYLNGKMVAEESKSLALDHEFKAVGLHDLNFEACYPSTWSDWTYRPTDITGPELVRGSTSPDRKRGVYLFTFFYPRIPYQDSTILEHAVGRAAKIMQEHGLPRDLSFARVAEPCGEYPLDNLSTNARWYQDSSRVSTARAWIADDGIAYVAMSANAARNGVDNEDCLLLTSLSNIYPPAIAPEPAADSSADNPTSGAASTAGAADSTPSTPVDKPSN